MWKFVGGFIVSTALPSAVQKFVNALGGSGVSCNDFDLFAAGIGRYLGLIALEA